MAQKCTNFFLEPDGYCTRCGEYHFRVAANEVQYQSQKESTKKKEEIIAVSRGNEEKS